MAEALAKKNEPEGWDMVEVSMIENMIDIITIDSIYQY
jgi:hypothetical protein